MGTTLPIQAITRDEQCQPRAYLIPDVIDQYAEEMAEGAIFPPVIVFHEADTYWLADGFHRVAAAEQAGLGGVRCEIREGTFRDAVLYSVGTNATHGLRRTNQDKRRAIETLIEDPDWSQWSDREIARKAAVSHDFVSRLRRSLATNDGDKKTINVKYTDRWGNEGIMNTANIGKRPDTPPSHVVSVQTESISVEPPRSITVEVSPPMTIDPGPAMEDDTWEKVPPATPAECQAVAFALESLFTAMERADGNRIDFADVVKYVLAESDDETRADFVAQAQKLTDDMLNLRMAIITAQAA